MTHKCMWHLPGLFGPNTIILYAQQAVLGITRKPGSNGDIDLGAEGVEMIVVEGQMLGQGASKLSLVNSRCMIW